jgi:phage recombination protein Bet
MKNEMIKYESAFGSVELTADTVKQYLVKGNGAVTDQEVGLFIKLCQGQKLNPFVQGEAYLIKFGTQPAQMVIGYDTYKRRAEENPNYLFMESGIVVLRGNQVVQKDGACLYPTEELIGGWCRVHKARANREVCTFKEVGFKEYNKGNAIWKEKPCTMIEKVAISQALREAFPKDYEGLYTSAEIVDADYNPDAPQQSATPAEPVVIDEPITQGERKAMFAAAQFKYGKELGNEKVLQFVKEEGLESTKGMMRSAYDRIMARIEADVLDEPEDEPELEPDDDGAVLPWESEEQ